MIAEIYMGALQNVASADALFSKLNYETSPEHNPAFATAGMAQGKGIEPEAGSGQAGDAGWDTQELGTRDQNPARIYSGFAPENNSK